MARSAAICAPGLFPRCPIAVLYERIRGTLVGTGAALGAYFALCLLLVIILYILGQLFTPSLLNQSSSSHSNDWRSLLRAGLIKQRIGAAHREF